MTYETHITIAASDKERARDVCSELGLCWKWSEIQGDPLLGDRLFGYLTTHTHTPEVARGRIEVALSALLPIQPVRVKVEKILYDTKTGVNELWK